MLGILNQGADMLSRGKWSDLFSGRLYNTSSPQKTTFTAQFISWCSKMLWPRLVHCSFILFLPGCPAFSGHQMGQGSQILTPPGGPLWRNQTWFPELIQLLSAAPWPIPLRTDLLSHVRGTIWHPWPELWSLHVWPLDGNLYSFPRVWLTLLWKLEPY